MFEINSPRFPFGTEARERASRSEMRAAMHALIKNAVEHGWLEYEVAMALADVAEDHVIALAQRKPPFLSVVPM